MQHLVSRVALLGCALSLFGCGRSSPIGSEPGCPIGAICIVPPDLAMGGHTSHDMSGGRDDMHRPGDMAFTPSDMKPTDMPGGQCGITISCTDPSCQGKPNCVTPGQEICNNGIDDNDNGLIDCADPECFNSPDCVGDMAVGDLGTSSCIGPGGMVDCSRAPCDQLPQCLHLTCNPEIEFGTVTPQNFDQTRTFDTVGSTESYQTCAFPGGTARVGEFELTTVTDVRLDFTQPSGSAHVVTLNRAGFDQLCDQNELYCLDAGEVATDTHTFAALQPGTYYVIVQSFPGTQGATTVRISTGKSGTPEICDNGIDDDGNGLIDCADYACVNAPNCVDLECKPEINLGAIVVGAPPVTASFDTRTSSNRYHPTCAGASTGNDIVVRFTLHETAGILVDWTQGAGADHVISIFNTPPAGVACDGDGQLSCFYPGGDSGGSVAFSPRPPGDYIFIFKSINPSGNGPMTINVSAFVNRQAEICNNGIDDDGNGLVDCADPACFGIDGCRPPICTADVDLGNFSWGSQGTAVLDVTGGTTYYEAQCAQGGGKSRIVKVTLTQPMGLGFDCNETGSQVFQLTQQLQPLDACDANPVNCADPTTLPFGCNFIMPNLQPGVYHVLVDAFAAGQEGSVNLTLFGEQEKVLEICNNGIDDDGNGLIDCADPACFTSPLCQQYTCNPDKSLGLLPLDSSTVSTTVQTAGNGDKFKAPCVSAVGGQDADVDFQLPATTDLTIAWAQAGNHDFALYPDVNDAAACNAGTVINCTTSNGAQTGSYVLTKIPGGKYHLIIDADKPGAEGGVVLQLAGTASK